MIKCKVLSILYKFSKVMLLSVALIACVIPGFKLIGSLEMQVLVTLIISFVIVFVADLMHVSCNETAVSSVIMLSFWFICALVMQIEEHIKYNDLSIWCYQVFYYDRIALLYVVLFSIILYNIIKLIRKSDNQKFIDEYKKFSRIMVIAFLVYYAVTLLYCFILCRRPGELYPDVNYVPFNAFKNTFLSGAVYYDMVFQFIGNFFIIMPLGFLAEIVLRKKHIILKTLLPIFISGGIELSQYFFKNGNPDIDDIILNVLGFYFGCLICLIIDKLAVKFSKGRLTSVFLF